MALHGIFVVSRCFHNFSQAIGFPVANWEFGWDQGASATRELEVGGHISFHDIDPVAARQLADFKVQRKL